MQPAQRASSRPLDPVARAPVFQQSTAVPPAVSSVVFFSVKKARTRVSSIAVVVVVVVVVVVTAKPWSSASNSGKIKGTFQNSGPGRLSLAASSVGPVTDVAEFRAFVRRL